jgi:8-oxo-dGTP diphosphatase
VSEVAGLLARLAGIPRTWGAIAYAGLVGPRVAGKSLVVHQGVVLSAQGVLLAVRGDLRGWELPGGSPHPGERGEDAVRREIREETGIEVAVEARVGDFVRSGFRPHVARVWRCRAVGGRVLAGAETLAVGWFDPRALPDTLFPWYREPIAEALRRRPEPVERRERLGLAAIWAGMRIDLRMRLRG